MVNNRSEVRIAPSGCLFRYSAVRYQSGFSRSPTSKEDRSRSKGRGSVGLSQDRFDSRRQPAQTPPSRPATVSPCARSGVIRHSKHARTVGNQSDGRNLPWLVRRHRVESSSPASLYADSQGAGHGPPSLLRAVFSDENRPQRTLRLAPPPATVSRSLEQHPARTSGAVTRPDLAVPCGDRRQRPDPQALRSPQPLLRVGHASPRAGPLPAL